MESVFKPLQGAPLEAGAGYHEPALYAPGPASANSPAIEVMTDLRLVPAATIDPETHIDVANQAMIARGVRSLLVVGRDGAVLGVVTSRDILGERPMQMVSKRGMRHEDIKVSDIMTPWRDMEVIDYADVLRARVGSVVETLKRSGRQHALVVDRDGATGRQMVRGIFSASQVARQLGVPMQAAEVARTFAEIEAAISEHAGA